MRQRLIDLSVLTRIGTAPLPIFWLTSCPYFLIIHLIYVIQSVCICFQQNIMVAGEYFSYSFNPESSLRVVLTEQSFYNDGQLISSGSQIVR